MYNPTKDGIEKIADSVLYTEAKPPNHLSDLVHCFWELKTSIPLSDDFCYHVLPDACVNILFDQIDTKIAAVTALNSNSKMLNLGKNFHYVGIQLLPGVWNHDPDEIIRDLVDKPYVGNLQLLKINSELVGLDFSVQHTVLIKLVEELIAQRLVATNVVISNILKNIDNINTVADMATTANISARQLQRILKKTTGFSPHDFLKILRLQQSFKKHYLTYYSDQSHFINSFQKITGYTPVRYIKKFDV